MKNLTYCFTSEAVSEGHPDKIADQISDAVLDSMLFLDPKARICCETYVTTDFVLVGGEYRTTARIDIKKIVREVIDRIGYSYPEIKFSSKTCIIDVRLHAQSQDISRGVDRENESQGAGDQGIIFGYATNETPNCLPLTYVLANKILLRLKEIRKEREGMMTYLRPDAKSQITIRYDEKGKPLEVDTIVVSTQHDEFVHDGTYPNLTIAEQEKMMLDQIKSDVWENVIKKVVPSNLLTENTRIYINPTGKFVIGGPHGDAGLTNRKIVVDTYGGVCPHGGGGMSGKDASKVDRSAAYMSRYISKNAVASGVADRMLIQLAYAIGVDQPISLFVNTFNTNKTGLTDSEVAKKLLEHFDFSPTGMEQILKLHEPKYFITASYGHMGRADYLAPVILWNDGNQYDNYDVHYFSWEELNLVSKMKTIFNV